MGIADGAQVIELARLEGVGLTTLQRWRRQFNSDGGNIDGHKGSHRHVCHRLSAEERQPILLICKEPEFAALTAGADRTNPRRSKLIHWFGALYLPDAASPRAS